MTRRSTLALGLPAVLLALTGCGSGDEAATATDPTPSAAPTASSTPTTAAPAVPSDEATARSLPGPDYQVPAVTTPLDTSALADDPCALLGPDQVTALQLGPGSPGADGTSCRWDVGADPVSLLVVGVRTGPLSTFFEGYVDNGDGSWEPTTVADLPGALVNGPFEASTGSCNLVLAVADDAYLRIERGTTTDQAQACDTARQAAELVVTTVRGPS